MALDKYWLNYIDFYVHEPGYWYQPKGLTVTKDNLVLIKKRLRVLRRYEGTDWGKSQRKYTRDLAHNGLIELRKPLRSYSGNDFAALARMNKVVFSTLGVAWVDIGHRIFITPFGSMFLKTRLAALSGLVAKQLLKFQLRNPGFPGMPESMQIFPHCFLLELLAWLPEGMISRDEYTLFVSRALSSDDFPNVLKRIQRYRKMNEAGQKELQIKLSGIPVLKAGKIQVMGRRKSLLNTIELNASYLLGLHTIPDYLELIREGKTAGGVRIRQDCRAEIAEIVQKHKREAWFVDYANELDWISVYGDPNRRGTITDAVEYYEKKLEVAKASEALLVGKKRGVIKRAIEPDKYTERLVGEKVLEVYLCDNLDELESGLVFIGRQVSTPTGPLDILAKDRKGRWVVVELKRDRATDKVIGQLQRYVGHVRTAHAAKPSGIRGMIVGRSITETLRMAIKNNVTFRVDLYKHDMRFKANIKPVAL